MLQNQDNICVSRKPNPRDQEGALAIAEVIVNDEQPAMRKKYHIRFSAKKGQRQPTLYAHPLTRVSFFRNLAWLSLVVTYLLFVFATPVEAQGPTQKETKESAVLCAPGRCGGDLVTDSMTFEAPPNAVQGNWNVV